MSHNPDHLIMVDEKNMPAPLKKMVKRFGIDGHGNFIIEWTRPMKLARLRGESDIDLIGLDGLPVGLGIKVQVKPIDQQTGDGLKVEVVSNKDFADIMKKVGG